MKIVLGSDHAGFSLKETIKEHLSSQGLDVIDCGTDSEESVDYPDFAEKVGRTICDGICEKGILVCGTGIGISIAANKLPGIRAAVCHDVFTAQASREHNDANILAMGARVLSPSLALEMVDTWLATPFSGGRHQRRIDKISALEK
ncbi:MAG: ribose 5-phosphate isomerase B [Peptococcaceae bacterium]|nr:ribose 5-phosphate isomerase B [Peptococcaceae bacterium]